MFNRFQYHPLFSFFSQMPSGWRKGLLIGFCVLLGLVSAIGLNQHILTQAQPGQSTRTPLAADSTSMPTLTATSVPGGGGATPLPTLTASPTIATTPGATLTPISGGYMPTPTLIATPTAGRTPTPTWTPTPAPGRTPTATPTPQPTLMVDDTFARQNQQFWGTAADEQSWQADAASNTLFSIQGKQGVLTGGGQAGYYDAILGAVTANAVVVFSGSINSYQQANMSALLRWQDANNWYKAYIDGTTLGFRRDVNGQVTTLAQIPFQASTNVNYTMRFRLVGNLLQVRVWQTDQDEPASWLLAFTDPAASLTPGKGGIRLETTSGTIIDITMFMEISQ